MGVPSILPVFNKRGVKLYRYLIARIGVHFISLLGMGDGRAFYFSARDGCAFYFIARDGLAFYFIARDGCVHFISLLGMGFYILFLG